MALIGGGTFNMGSDRGLPTSVPFIRDVKAFWIDCGRSPTRSSRLPARQRRPCQCARPTLFDWDDSDARLRQVQALGAIRASSAPGERDELVWRPRLLPGAGQAFAD